MYIMYIVYVQKRHMFIFSHILIHKHMHTSTYASILICMHIAYHDIESETNAYVGAMKIWPGFRVVPRPIVRSPLTFLSEPEANLGCGDGSFFSARADFRSFFFGSLGYSSEDC